MRRFAQGIVIAVSVLMSGCLLRTEQMPAAVRASVEAQLAGAGLSYPRAASAPDFLRRASLSAADATDWIVDFNEAQGSYCGTGGCPLQVWVRGAGEAYRLAFDEPVLGWRLEGDEGRQALHVRLHGALCGKSALEDCVQIFHWTGGRGGDGRFVTTSGGRPRPLVQPIRFDPDDGQPLRWTS